MELLRNLDCSKTRSDLECFSPAFKKHACCKNAKVTKLRPLNMFCFCPSCCREHVCWILNRSALGPTSFSKHVITLFSECSIGFTFHQAPGLQIYLSDPLGKYFGMSSRGYCSASLICSLLIFGKIMADILTFNSVGFQFQKTWSWRFFVFNERCVTVPSLNALHNWRIISCPYLTPSGHYQDLHWNLKPYCERPSYFPLPEPSGSTFPSVLVENGIIICVLLARI